MLRNMFKKTYTKIDIKYRTQGKTEDISDNLPMTSQEETSPSIPAGLWKKCNKCKKSIYSQDVRDNFYICPKCNGYFRVNAYRRIDMIADEGTFVEWDQTMASENPLNFPGYEKKLAATREKTKLDEAVVTGKALVGGHEAVIGVCDARFIMSSMGHNVGEKIARAVEQATRKELPVILFACSGGARMQEGLISLMQMAKTAASIKKHHEAGQLFISVLTDPTTGGVTASFAMLGDIILAEPGALIGFAGPRVIEQTIGQKLPEGFQRAEFLLEHGFIDRIVKREEMKETLAQILKLHERRTEEERISFVNGKFKKAESESPEDISRNCDSKLGNWSVQSRSGENTRGWEAIYSKGESEAGGRKEPEKRQPVIRSAWDSVLLSRKSDRPVSSDYIHALFDDFMEFHGDRYFKDDRAVIGGIANFHGMPVTVIGQEKGRTTKENIVRNFGMPSPEGYRKALRLMKQAETFGRPIICFVDTPGAFCGIEAEERGQGEAIARNLFEMTDLKVPVLSIVIGEGGSGGALALAMANEVWMMENAIYSILSPEGFASILWKDAKKAGEAARVMRITAKELKELGLIERVIAEQEPANQENLPYLAATLDVAIREFLGTYGSMDGEGLAEARYARFRKF